jgi:hypothetical protein
LIHKSGCLDSNIAYFCLSGGSAATFATVSAQSGHSLAALAKVPNPLGAEEEVELYRKTPHKIGVATSIKSLPAPTSAANRTRSDVSRSDDDPRLRRFAIAWLL